ncbi:MAG TPA: hypothetical protein VMK12_20680, partial [Anaeromyxobacteraceae bacterium]|nr:hypothetical protein [Anaeromyxobacteraceae bacterium]
HRYIESGATESFEFSFKGDYLYIASRRSAGPFGGRTRSEPLCRLRFQGVGKAWSFEIYKYSDNWYDEERDFPFSSGTPEECLAVAADFYLLEYDVLSAGSSLGEKPKAAQATVRPSKLRPAPVDCPEVPTELLPALRGPILDDFSTFLKFVQGRSFELGERTNGFSRAHLAELNGQMVHPKALHSRIIQPRVPRIQECFFVAEALGLLVVQRTLHRASGGPGIADFLARSEVERWWAHVEALWQRIDWRALLPDALGDTEAQQGGRYFIGEELARRTRPLEFTRSLTVLGEVFEWFLFPSWRDAGLVKLTFSGADRKKGDYLAARATNLVQVDVTPLGRWTFALLAQQSPHPEKPFANENDGRWSGDDLLRCAIGAGFWDEGD